MGTFMLLCLAGIAGAQPQPTAWLDTDRTEPPETKYKTFFSKTINGEASYLVYLPPGYDETDRRYPVLYWLHGTGGAQRAGGDFVQRLDAAIRQSKSPAIMVILVNGLAAATMYCDTRDGKWPLETVIVNDLIPHVDATYRTIASRQSRGVEGFSMGGFGAAHLGFKFPDLFGVVSILAPALLGPDLTIGPVNQWRQHLEGPMGGDVEYFQANNPFTLAERNADRIRGRQTIRIAAHLEPQNWLVERCERLSQTLRRNGIEQEFQVRSNVTEHNYRLLYDDMGEAVFAFFEKGFAKAVPLGTVPELAEPCAAGPLPNTTCRRLQVRCDPLNPVDVQIRITEPAAGVPVRGTVLFGSGGSGTGFYAAGADGQALFRDLAGMGFRIVDRAWVGPDGWTTGEGGMRKTSCRHATLLTWIRDRIHTQGKFVASGNSGGSAEIGYALTTWERGDILDLAVPTSGPATARLDYVCANPPPPEWVAMCPANVPPGALECTPSCTLPADQGVCYQASRTPTPEILRADSVVHPEAALHYSKTRVHFLYGTRDCGQSVPAGLTWSANVTGERIIEFVPNTPHGMFSTPEGREAIRRAIDLGTAQSVANVSSASYRASPVAAGAIVTAFGSGLATTTAAASALPLPTALGGSTVKVRDSKGSERLAPLFSVSPTQASYLMPDATALGLAAVTITSGSGVVSQGAPQIVAVAPGLYTLDASGRGLAAAFVQRIKADGARSTEAVGRYDPAQGKWVAIPIDLGAETDQVFLELYGTGLRSRSSLDQVTCRIGGLDAPVTYAGAQVGTLGLDQVNVRLPRTLAGRGEVNVTLTVQGQEANSVKVSIK
jgi:endo-1,4-beta-xylanase